VTKSSGLWCSIPIPFWWSTKPPKCKLPFWFLTSDLELGQEWVWRVWMWIEWHSRNPQGLIQNWGPFQVVVQECFCYGTYKQAWPERLTDYQSLEDCTNTILSGIYQDVHILFFSNAPQNSGGKDMLGNNALQLH
jgi:hypothetical protein